MGRLTRLNDPRSSPVVLRGGHPNTGGHPCRPRKPRARRGSRAQAESVCTGPSAVKGPVASYCGLGAGRAGRGLRKPNGPHGAAPTQHSLHRPGQQDLGQDPGSYSRAASVAQAAEGPRTQAAPHTPALTAPHTHWASVLLLLPAERTPDLSDPDSPSHCASTSGSLDSPARDPWPPGSALNPCYARLAPLPQAFRRHLSPSGQTLSSWARSTTDLKIWLILPNFLLFPKCTTFLHLPSFQKYSRGRTSDAWDTRTNRKTFLSLRGHVLTVDRVGDREAHRRCRWRNDGRMDRQTVGRTKGDGQCRGWQLRGTSRSPSAGIGTARGDTVTRPLTGWSGRLVQKVTVSRDQRPVMCPSEGRSSGQRGQSIKAP